MIDQEEAQKLAQALVKQLVKDAGCRDMRDVTNVLSAVLGVAGMSILESAGKQEAMLRMSAAATYVATREQRREMAPERMH